MEAYCISTSKIYDVILILKTKMIFFNNASK
jgi:hypothetical protein